VLSVTNSYNCGCDSNRDAVVGVSDNADEDHVDVDAVSMCYSPQPVPMSSDDCDPEPVPDTSCCTYQLVAVPGDSSDRELVPVSSIDCDGELVPVPSDSSDSGPASMSSTPAKSLDTTALLNVSVSAGSSDEPSSDFECFRGPYVNTRDLLLLHDEACSEQGALSDVSSQPEQLAHPSMDECWLVTPPPCFMGSPQQAVVMSNPLEDLLIEHPSMSVYHPRHRRQAVMESSASSVEFSPARNNLLPLSASIDALPPQPADPSPPGTQPVELTAPSLGEMPPPRPEIIPRRVPRLNRIFNNVSTVHPSSWSSAGPRLHSDNARSFLDRKNRLRAVVGHGHGYRRSQRMTVIQSGMNNSRHCQ